MTRLDKWLLGIFTAIFLCVKFAVAQQSSAILPGTNYLLYAPLMEGAGSNIMDWKGGHFGNFSNAAWISPGIISCNSNTPYGHDPIIFFNNTNWADNPTNLTAAIWYKFNGVAPTFAAFLLGKCGNVTNPFEVGDGWFLTCFAQDSGVEYQYTAGAGVLNNGGNSAIAKVSSKPITDGNWHWIVGVWTGGTGGATAVTVYLDGVQGTTNYPLGTFTAGCANTGKVTIGGCGVYDATGTEYLAQPVILNNFAITSSQVTTLWNSASTIAVPHVNWALIAP